MRMRLQAIAMIAAIGALSIGCAHNPRGATFDHSFIACPACSDCHCVAARPTMPSYNATENAGEFHSLDSRPQPINKDALEQPKHQWGGCPNGRCRQVYVPGLVPQSMLPAQTQSIVRTSTPPPNQLISNKTNEVKTGVYGCSKCGQPTVGQDWHQVWTREGTSALYLCERCWEASTPAQRKLHLERYLEKQGINDAAKAALREAVR